MFNKSTIAAVAVLGLAAFTAPAFAADLVIEDQDYPVMEVSSGSSWEGAYIGGYVGGFPTDPSWYVGGQIGYNFMVSESFLMGLQASGEYSPDGDYFNGWLDVKAGVAMDMFAVYALGGVGIQDGGDALWRIGAGAEVMLADNVSIFGEGFLAQDIGDIPDVPQVQAGIRFHF